MISERLRAPVAPKSPFRHGAAAPAPSHSEPNPRRPRASRVLGLCAFCFARANPLPRIRRTVRGSKRTEEVKVDKGLWMACLAAIPGSFQYGFGLSVINVPQAAVCRSLGLAQTSLTWSSLVAVLSPSGLLGAWLAPSAVRRLGLVTALCGTSIFFLISGALFPFAAQAAARSQLLATALFASGRVVAGLGAGAATVFVPLYLGRIAPLQLRGAVGNLHQVAIVLGLLVAQLAGAALPWPRTLALAALFGALQLLLMPWLREVPEETTDSESQAPIGGFGALGSSELRRPMAMAVALMALQQYCGINGVWYYSTSFFTEAGLPNPLAGTLVSSAIFMVATLVAVPLIEKAGRRSLLLRGQTSAAIALSILTASLCAKAAGGLGFTDGLLNGATLMSVIAFVVSFAISLGPIPWQIANEIFPLRCRAEAQCVIASLCEIFSASVALGFPVLQRILGARLAFLPSVVVLLLGYLYVRKNLPETKNREVKDILSDFNRRR
ncbi:unnamed protein product [Effrenium voratum]|nr:unnamed protein product [Effrenium voratum]